MTENQSALAGGRVLAEYAADRVADEGWRREVRRERRPGGGEELSRSH